MLQAILITAGIILSAAFLFVDVICLRCAGIVDKEDLGDNPETSPEKA